MGLAWPTSSALSWSQNLFMTITYETIIISSSESLGFPTWTWGESLLGITFRHNSSSAFDLKLNLFHTYMTFCNKLNSINTQTGFKGHPVFCEILRPFEHILVIYASWLFFIAFVGLQSILYLLYEYPVFTLHKLHMACSLRKVSGLPESDIWTDPQGPWQGTFNFACFQNFQYPLKSIGLYPF